MTTQERSRKIAEVADKFPGCTAARLRDQGFHVIRDGADILAARDAGLITWDNGWYAVPTGN